MSQIEELLDFIFGGKKTAFSIELGGWLRASRRYKDFVDKNRTKIRSKLTNSADASKVKNLRAELEIAAILHTDAKFSVEYEGYAAAKQRGPDFTVTFKTHTSFNAEVRRVPKQNLVDEDSETRVERLMAIICDKLNQMPTGAINFLWLVAESEITELDLNRAASKLLQNAERKSEYFERPGFESPAAFLKAYGRLSGTFVRSPAGAAFFQNTAARHKASPELLNALKRVAQTQLP